MVQSGFNTAAFGGHNDRSAVNEMNMLMAAETPWLHELACSRIGNRLGPMVPLLHPDINTMNERRAFRWEEVVGSRGCME